MLRLFALLICYGIIAAHANIQRGFPVQSATDLQQPDGKLLRSMHCFNRSTGVWLNSVDWKSSVDFLVGPCLYINVSFFTMLDRAVRLTQCACACVPNVMVYLVWCRQPAPLSGTCKMQMLQKAHYYHLLAKLPICIWILPSRCHRNVQYESGCTLQTRLTRQENYRSMQMAFPQTLCMTCLPKAIAVAP